MNISVLGHVATIIADLVVEEKVTKVRALLLSYPARALPELALRVHGELNPDMQVRFADYARDLAEDA